MEAIVNTDTCTGCGSCVNICPDVFDLPDTVAVVIVEAVPPGAVETCREAEEDCPVEAIRIKY